VGDQARDRSPVGVVVTGPVRSRRFVLDQARQVLASIGSPVPVRPGPPFPAARVCRLRPLCG